MSSRFEDSCIFPTVTFHNWHYSAIYAIVPTDVWDTRRLQYIHTDMKTRSPFTFEFAMNVVPPNCIAGAVIFKRSTEDNYQIEAVFDVDAELILSPAMLSGSLGEPGKRAITLMKGRMAAGGFQLDLSDFMIPPSESMNKDVAISSLAINAAQWIERDAIALGNSTALDEYEERRKIMERFEAEKPPKKT